jgi:hypothetical protein
LLHFRPDAVIPNEVRNLSGFGSLEEMKIAGRVFLALEKFKPNRLKPVPLNRMN